MPEEIERVFLLDRLPDLPPHAAAWRIEQGYLPDPPAGSQPGTYYEGRLRRKVSPEGKEHFIHTIKSGQGLVREENERDIEASEFDCEWAQTLGRRISKTRYKVAEGPVVWEIDAFDEFPIVLAEVELESADQTVEIPAWLAPHVVSELTEDPRYRNYALATVGLPADHPS
ncbi:MAG: adenylate cyclase [Planctomycetes bacterium]|nr:adenylate cyclase [Planctomycetota bacterium]